MQQFEKPKSVTPIAVGGAGEPEISVMPEKFRGVTLEAKIPEMSVPAARPSESRLEPGKPTAPGEQKKFPWFWVILIFVIVAALGASIFFVLQGLRVPASKPIVQQTQPTTPVVTKPVEQPIATREVTIPATAEISLPATVEVTLPPLVEEIVGGVDADSDGLTDIEEALYGTDSRIPDTDQDGFLDGNEVYHLYNPGGTAPVTLLESGLVKNYQNADFDYQIYYPAVWNANVEKGADTVLLSAASGEFLQVLAQDNPQDLSLEDWYLAQAPGVNAEELKTFTNKAGLVGLQSPDRLTAYFKKDSRIFVISLNLGAKTVIEFRRTYEMMLNSFKFGQQ